MRIVHLLGIAVSVGYFVLTIRNPEKWYNPMWCVLAALVLIYGQLRPVVYSWSVMRRRRTLYGPRGSKAVARFGEDSIEMRNGKQHSVCKYEQLTRTIRLKHSYALIIDKRMGFMINPNCFNVGQMKDFPAFFREKCPGASIAD